MGARLRVPVEVSAGTVAMDQAAKQELIAEAARHFIVLAEVGSRSARRGHDTQRRGRWHGTPTAQARAPVAQIKPKGRIGVIVRRGRRFDNRFLSDWMIMH